MSGLVQKVGEQNAKSHGPFRCRFEGCQYKIATTLQQSSKNLPQRSEIKKSLAIILWLVFNKLSISGTDFQGGGGQGIWHPPANYIYFDLIVSYLIILTTKFVKLPILWS
jgi:hypothetical protein